MPEMPDIIELTVELINKQVYKNLFFGIILKERFVLWEKLFLHRLHQEDEN